MNVNQKKDKEPKGNGMKTGRLGCLIRSVRAGLEVVGQTGCLLQTAQQSANVLVAIKELPLHDTGLHGLVQSVENGQICDGQIGSDDVARAFAVFGKYIFQTVQREWEDVVSEFLLIFLLEFVILVENNLDDIAQNVIAGVDYGIHQSLFKTGVSSNAKFTGQKSGNGQALSQHLPVEFQNRQSTERRIWFELLPRSGVDAVILEFLPGGVEDEPNQFGTGAAIKVGKAETSRHGESWSDDISVFSTTFVLGDAL